MKKLLVCILFVLINTQVTAQDYYKGLDAYGTGDYASALEEFNALAKQENARGQFMLGVMYGSGAGVPKDYSKAAKWYRLSAQQGYSYAQHNLGFMYYNGRGVMKDYSKAAKWLRLSAKQGYSTSQFNLGVMYEDGDGVIKDNVTAHMWYNISSANGDEHAEDRRDRIEINMTLVDISKATSMARECMASDYKKCGY
jgi:TPR repeat protein